MRLYVSLSSPEQNKPASQQELLRRIASFGRVETKNLPPPQTKNGVSWYTFIDVGDDASFSYAKCKSVLHGTRWKGGQLQLDKAKPNYEVRLDAERKERAELQERQKLGPKRRRKTEAAIARIGRSTAEVKSGPSPLMPELKPSESVFKWHRGKNPQVFSPVLKLRKSKNSPLFTFDPVKSIAGHLYFGEEDDIVDESKPPSTIFESVDYVAPEPDQRLFSSRLAKRVRPDIDVSRVPSSYQASYDDLSFVPIDESDDDDDDDNNDDDNDDEEEEESDLEELGIVTFGDDEDPFAGLQDGFATGGDSDNDSSSSGSVNDNDSNSGDSDSEQGDFQDSASDDDNSGFNDDNAEDDQDPDEDGDQEDDKDNDDDADDDDNDDDDDEEDEEGNRRKGLERKVLMEMFSDDSSDGEVFGVVDIDDGEAKQEEMHGKTQQDSSERGWATAEDPWKEGFDEADPGLLDSSSEPQVKPTDSRSVSQSSTSSLNPRRKILAVPDVIPEALRDEPIFCRTATKRVITEKWKETRPALNRKLKSTAQHQKKHK